MKGDFSRSTHRDTNRYSSVRLQQGRVLLDAEWNEQADLGLQRERTASIDVIGRTGAPKHAPGEFRQFQVALADEGRDLILAPGHIYVDGLRCENHRDEGTRLSRQPDLPGVALPVDDGLFAVYLDVWERHVTAVDQSPGGFPALREVALGGPDTATRVQVLWQARLVETEEKGCGAFVAPPAPTGRLRARAVAGEDASNDCLVPQGGGYRRLENQLYRVEIHDTLDNAPRFKWSRDNGSIVSRVLAVDDVAKTIRVEDPGRDDVLGFASARFVELTDEARVLRNEPGLLLEVQTVLGDEVTVVIPVNTGLAVGSQPTLRRWDGVGTIQAGAPIDLEDGVQVEFDAGTFAPGDYWQIPARTLTGRVEWPLDDNDPPQPVFERRHGTDHHYCALAAVRFGGGVFSNLADCRPLFPPLTAIAASDVSYDPSACSNLATVRTVQEAIDLLCRTSGGSEPGIHIEKVALMSGRALENDVVIAPAELARGINITCDRPVFQDSVRNTRGLPNPVCRVTIDLPWPTTSIEAEQWQMASLGSIGFTTVTVAGQVDADGPLIVWTPHTGDVIVDVASWLSSNLLEALAQRTHGQITRLLARLSLTGNFIWGPRGPDLYLDGEVFGVPARGHTALRLPSGNNRSGGNFEMWFWLGREETPQRPERVGVIPGRLSRFFSSNLGREAVAFGIQREHRSVVEALPPNYDVDAAQPFDPQRAAAMAGRTGVRNLTGLSSTRFEKLGTVLNDMLSTHLRLEIRTTAVEDNALLRQVRTSMAAGNPPDFVVGDEALMTRLNELQYPGAAMLAI
jgi:hypothetical protein